MISLLVIGGLAIIWFAWQFFLCELLHKFTFPTRSFTFDPNVLNEITKEAIKKETTDEVIKEVHKSLVKRWPEYIARKREWLWFHRGGQIGTVCFLHLSFTEYVIVYGAPWPHSRLPYGRSPAEIHTYPLKGQLEVIEEGTMESKVIKEGERHYFFTMESFSSHSNTELWTLEYGRGIIPLTLPVQFFRSFISTWDLGAFLKLWILSIKFMFYELVFNGKL